MFKEAEVRRQVTWSTPPLRTHLTNGKWKPSESDVCTCSGSKILRSDGDGNENVTKAIALITKPTILLTHQAFLYISLQSLRDYDVKNDQFHVVHRKNTSNYEIFSLFLNLDMALRNSNLEGFTYI